MLKKRPFFSFIVSFILIFSFSLIVNADQKKSDSSSLQLTSNQQLNMLEKIHKLHPPKSTDYVKRPADMLMTFTVNGIIDLSNAPDSIANIAGVVVDYEYNPILMYPSDPYSWGRHLWWTKYYDDETGDLVIAPKGYATYYTTGGNYACAVPYYWEDVNRGDYVIVDNLEDSAYSIRVSRTDFGPNQKIAGDHIVDLGPTNNTNLHGNGHNYCDTYVLIRQGNHY